MCGLGVKIALFTDSGNQQPGNCPSMKDTLSSPTTMNIPVSQDQETNVCFWLENKKQFSEKFALWYPFTGGEIMGSEKRKRWRGGLAVLEKVKIKGCTWYWGIIKHNEKDHYRSEKGKVAVFYSSISSSWEKHGIFLQMAQLWRKAELLLDFYRSVISWSPVFSKCSSSVKCPSPHSKKCSLLINPMT